jgi:hypothetical protein
MVEMGVRDETAIHRVMGVEPPAELGEVEAVAVLDVPGHGANLAGAPADQTDWPQKDVSDFATGRTYGRGQSILRNF